MKLIHLIPLLSGLFALASHAEEAPVVLSEQEIRAIGPLPEDKVAETVKKGEYNPFAERAATQITKEDGESEDSKLLALLNRMPLSGIIKDSDGRYKVLFGGRLLSEGDRLPKYLGDRQTSLQRVSKVTDKVVEFSWVEDQAGAVPRKVTRNVKVNENVIETRQSIPDENGKKSGMIVNTITSNGETLRDVPAEQPEETKAIPTGNNGSDVPHLDHRPAPASSQSRGLKSHVKPAARN